MPGDVAAIRAMVEPRETWATGFSFRAVDDSGRLARMQRGKGGVYILGRDGSPEPLEMAVLLSESGTAFPVLAGDFDDGGPGAVEILGRLRGSRTARDYSPAACVGARDHVGALEAALGWTPALDVDYDAMDLEPGAWPGGRGQASGAAPATGGAADYRKASAADLDALYPLAAEYERVEVITELHVFDPAACRAAQARSLARQVVYLATVRGRVVARAQTNARGWSYDQIGGVFVDPEYRGLGIGRGIMDALMDDIASRGRGAALFVKKSNAVARSLYSSMGFRASRDYRVSYFA